MCLSKTEKQVMNKMIKNAIKKEIEEMSLIELQKKGRNS